MGNDGPKTPTELEKLDHLIEIEERKWTNLGIDISQISPNSMFDLMVQVMSHEAMLVEKGVCTQEEIDVKFLQTKLEKMKKTREDLEPQIEAFKEEQRRQSIIVPHVNNIIRPQ